MNYNQTDNWDAWAVPKQVPVAWMEPDGSLMYVSEVSNPSQPTKTAVPLYAAPPAAPAPVVPLTDERLQKHAMRAGDCPPGSMVVLLSSLRRMLSAAPVVREPLTDEQIDRIRLETREWHILGYLTAIRFARAIEAHHGIGGGGK